MKISAFSKDIFRTISKESKRFFAMVIITILGVTMFSGLIAACMDLRKSADSFYDRQHLHDFYIASTLGLTEEDVETLLLSYEIEKAEGVYTESVLAILDDHSVSISMRTLSVAGIDVPYVVEGRLPESVNEIAVTEEFINDSGLSVGDTFTIEETLEEDEDPTFANTEYTICGIVIDVTSVDNPDGNTSFRSDDTSDMTAFILPEAADTDIYTAVYLILRGTSDMFCYDSEYENTISEFKKFLENNIKSQREKARYESLVNDAQSELDDAEAEVNEELNDAYNELMDGEKELSESLEEARLELEDGERELIEGLEEGRLELEAGERELSERLEEAKLELEAGERQLAESLAGAKAELDLSASELDDAQKQIDDGWAQLEQGEAELARQEEAADKLFADAWAEIEENKKLLDDSSAEFMPVYESTMPLINAGLALIDAGKSELSQQEDATYTRLNEREAALTAQLNEAAAVRDSLAAQEAEIISQKNNIAAVLGEYWPEAQWNALAAAAERTVSNPLASYDAELASLTEALNALPEDVKAAAGDSLSAVPDLAISLGTTRGNISAAESEISQAEAGLSLVAQERAQTESTFAALWETIETQEADLRENKETLESTYASIKEGYEQLNKGIEELEASEAAAREQFDDARKTIEENRQALTAAQAELDSGRAMYEDGLRQYEEGKIAGEAELASGWAQYEEGKAEGEAELADGWAQYEEGKAEGEAELADGWAQYEEGKAEGEAELADGWKEYEEGKAEAEAELSDARAKIAEIDMATWYIQDRTSLSGYNNISSDAASIETLGTVFPVIFFTIAILISLTTITRMVDEDRSFIGTYMALGFSVNETKQKYLFYSLTAGIIGSILGTLGAFILLPVIICSIFDTMYLLPEFVYTFVPSAGILGPLIFIGGILLVTEYACRRKMRHKPATLMRPKAPKSGTRIFLERITFVWSKLSFLSKVTARNIFRYKKRLLMTILGIAGCTALLLLGFSVKDSVADLMPGQYERVFSYDVMAAAHADDNEKLLSYIENDPEIASYVNAEITSANLTYNDGDSLSITLMVIPDDCDFDSYVSIYDLDGDAQSLKTGRVYVTRNAADVLGFEAGDNVSLQLVDLEQAEFPVSAVVENYLGNYIYMDQTTFEIYFEEFEPNGVLINLSDECEDPSAYAAELKSMDGVISCTCTQDLTEDFSSAFELINLVVYVVIVMSAALAFVVLFTLQTTNISEREREIATIKVLGFYDLEVHSYINRETYILSSIGILLGMPLGYAFAQSLSLLLNLPSIYLPSSLHPISYLYAALLDIAFTLMVNLITNRSLNRLDPAVALKSVE